MRLRKMLTAMLIASLSLPKVVLAGPILSTEYTQFSVDDDEYKLSTLEEGLEDSDILDMSNFNNMLRQRVPSLAGKQDISIEDYATIEVLDLSNLGLSEVPPQIILLENLKELKLDNNNISTIPDVIQEYLVGLSKFSIVDNTLVNINSSLISKFGEDSFEFNVLPNMSNKQYKVLFNKTFVSANDLVDEDTSIAILSIPDDTAIQTDSTSDISMLDLYSSDISEMKTKTIPSNWDVTPKFDDSEVIESITVYANGVKDFDLGSVEDLYSIDGLSLYVGDILYSDVRVDDSMIMPIASHSVTTTLNGISYSGDYRSATISVSAKHTCCSGTPYIHYFNADGTVSTLGSSASKTVTENGTYRFAGGYSGYRGNYVSAVVDKIVYPRPDISLTKSTSSQTKSLQLRISVSISGGSISNIQLTAPGKAPTYISNNSSVTVTENGTYTVRAESDRGKVTMSSITIDNIDNVAPDLTVSLASTEWGKSVPISISSSDKSGISKVEYKEPGSSSLVTCTSNGTLNVTKNGVYTFRAVDTVGNISVEKTVTVDKVDTTAPTLNLSLGTTDFSKSVPINIGVSDSESGVKLTQYKLPNSNSWVQCTGSSSITATMNGVYTFMAVDNVGNAVEKTITVSNVDTTAPIVSAVPNNVWGNTVNITVSSSDSGSGIAKVEYQKPGESTWSTCTSNGNLVADKNGTYSFRAIDNAGNISSVATASVTHIDTIIPTISAVAGSDWCKTVPVTITADDQQSGLAKIEYLPPNGSWTSLGTTKSFDATVNGTYKLRATDNAGNVSGEISLVVDKVDDVKPTISIVKDKDGFTQSLNLNISVSDNSQNLSSIRFKKDSGQWENINANTTKVITQNGTYTVEATDAAGNVATESITINNVDTDAPIVNIDESTPWGEVVELSFTVQDVDSNIKHTFDSQNCTLVGYKIRVTQNGSYTMTSVDTAGNTTTTPFTVSKVDTVKPVIECDPVPTAPTNKDVVIAYRTSDDLSGVSRVVNSKGVELPVNGEVRFEVNGSETLTVYDNAGLSSSITITVSNIDKTPPEVTVGEMTAWGLSAVLDLTIKDTNDYDIELSSDKCTLVDGKIHISENGIYTITVTDKAGNKTSKEFTVKMIDTFAPEFEYELSTTDFTNKDVVIRYRVNDADSGLKYLKIDGKPVQDYTGTVTISQNRNVVFEYQDAVGNVDTTEVVVENIDKVSPTLDCKLTNTNPTKDDILLTFKALDDYSGVESVTINGEKQASNIGDYIISSNGDYEVVVVDKAGNTLSEVVTVTNIDKVPPVINYVDPPTEWTKENILVDLEVTDNANPVTVTVNDKALQSNGTHYELVITENGKYVIKATDSVGNVTKKEISVSNIERYAPVISDVSVEVYNGFVNEGILDFNVTDKESGVAEFRVNDVVCTTSSALRVDMSKDITISAKDHASNESVVVENFAHKIPNPPKFPTITLPNYKPVVDKDDNILVDKDGNLPMPDGSIIYPDGGTTGNGSLVHPDGTVDTGNDKITSNPDGGLLLDKDGNVTDQQGNIIIDKDGNIYYPGTDDIFIDKDGNIYDKDGDLVIDNNGNVYLPDLNVDTNGDGIPDINIDIDKDGEPELNVDLDGDKSPDVDIDTDGDRVPDINVDIDKDGLPDTNIDNDQLPTWNPNTIIPGDPVYGTDSSIKTEINIDKDGDGKPDINIDIDKDGNPDINIDNNNDKIPDINIDINKDNKPDINIDIDKDSNPDINIDTNGDGIPDINIDIDKDNVPDLNIDLDGDKSPDIDIDTNLDTKTDINIDIDGDKKPDVNIDVDQLPVWKPTDISKDEPVYGTDSTIKPDINIDTDGDGKVDINIDSNGDGIPDINIDINGDGKPELNLDLDDDLSPDIDIDTNLDMKPDVNVDTDGDGVPNINIDTNQLPTWNPTDIHKDEPLYGTDSSISPDTKLDKNNNGVPDEDEKRPVDDNANQEKPESSLPTLPELPKDEEGFKEFVDTLTESEKQQLNDMLEGVMPFTIKMDYKWEEAIGVSPKVLDIVEIEGTDFVDVSFKYIESEDGVRTLVETLEPTNTLTPDTQGHWAEASIVLAGENGYMKGRTKDEFVPKGTLTVAEAMITLDRVLLDGDIVYTKNERAKVEKSLVDVQDHWAYYNAGSIMTKVEYEDDKFTKDILNSNINREELARILYYVLRNITTVEDFKYPSIVYKDMLEIKDLVAVDMCTRMGIFLGDNNGMFNPKAELTRAELAEILERVAHVVKSSN